MDYIEQDEQLGAEIHWKGAKIVFSMKTHRETLLEFVERPGWGLSCYMNGSIQSCLSDEATYHKQLTESIVCGGNIAIFGGGEGATARELLRNPVQHITAVDMFEWDRDVVEVFRTKFPQWGKGIWNDSRLHVYNYDIFEHISTIPDSTYNSLVVDLFEPHDQTEAVWNTLFQHMYRIMNSAGTWSMYAGMCPHTNDLSIQYRFCAMLREIGFVHVDFIIGEFIPSYLGRPVFLYGIR